MKFSIVTISFNQVQYLRRCIESVLGQDGVDFEYVVVDPGSSDGSRELILEYGDKLKVIFEPDTGPANGLNKGFSACSGDVFYYLNSDDVLLPGVLKEIRDVFLNFPDLDIVYGDGYVINEEGTVVRRCFSDRFSLRAAAYGASVVIQPSTFFKRCIFEKVGGFNEENRSNWDGELLIDMVINGASLHKVSRYLSCYRVHDQGITGSGKMVERHKQHANNMFEKILNRRWCAYDPIIALLMRVHKHLRNPVATVERIFKGPIFGVSRKESRA